MVWRYHDSRNALCRRSETKTRVGVPAQTAASGLYGIRNMGQLIGKRARVEGFIVSDFQDRFNQGRAWLSARIADGSLRHRVHVLDGLERAPEGLGMLFRGGNTGKLVVRVGG